MSKSKSQKINPPNYCGSNNYYPKNIANISYDDGTYEYWEKFRGETAKVKEKSEDDFEKYLNVFGSGGLLVGLTLLSKLVETHIRYQFQWMLILGSILFLACLLSNLLSHYMAIHNNDKNINDIDTQCEELWTNFERRNKNIAYVNRTSLGSIISGTILITLFLILNINTMAKQQQTPQEKPKNSQSDPKPSSENKGRTTTQPSFQIKPKK